MGGGEGRGILCHHAHSLLLFVFFVMSTVQTVAMVETWLRQTDRQSFTATATANHTTIVLLLLVLV